MSDELKYQLRLTLRNPLPMQRAAELTDLTQRKVGVIVFVGTPSLGRLTAAREAIGTPCRHR